MKNLKQKLVLFSLLMFMMLPVFLMGDIPMVMAAEEDEEDNFTSMPNYRWLNESTTDSNVNEQLISNDVYQITNTNNETSGTQKIEKSRALNSRDLYFDTRFNMDIAGNQTEYFRDVLGDACDFTEDVEGWIAQGGSLSVNDGILAISIVNDFDGIVFNPLDYVLGQGVYSTIEVRLKGTKNWDLYLTTFFKGSIVNTNFGFDPTSDWQILTYDFESLSPIDGLRFLTVNDLGSGYIYIDYIKVIGNLDYATHAEGEIEDTWDWEDSREYFYDEESNISDFNDGTTEWVTGSADVEVSLGSGSFANWLKIQQVNTTDNDLLFGTTTGLSIDSSEFRWLTMEIMSSTGTINHIQIMDGDSNILSQSSDSLSSEDMHLVSYDLLNANWTGIEAGLLIDVNFTGSPHSHRLNVNFTFLYDCELGDIENWFGDSRVNFQFVEPSGVFTSVPLDTETYMAVYCENAPQYIDTDIFKTVEFRIKVMQNTGIMKFRFWAYNADGVHLMNDTFFFPQMNTWTTYIFDIEETWIGDSDWEDGNILRNFGFYVYEDTGNWEGIERFKIDYTLVTGEFDNSEGFKYSLLNRDHEEGVTFEFTRNNEEYNSYNFTVDFMDSIGVALHYTEQFNYSLNDGWLDLSVELNLNKKKIKLTLEYENGTDIVYVRSLYALYGNIGTPNLKILDIGFPHFCINVSTLPMSRTTLQIDYIDASWTIMDWKQPAGNAPVNFGQTFDQSLVADVQTAYTIDVFDDTYSGGGAYEKESAWFMLNVDRFDGVSMDITTLASDIEIAPVGDFMYTLIYFCNVRADGTLDDLLAFQVTTGGYFGTNQVNYGFWWFNDTGTPTGVAIDEYAGLEGQASLNVYLDTPNNQLIAQTVVDVGSSSTKQSINVSRSEVITSEMVIFIITRTYDESAAGDADHWRMQISGFDLVRKDLLGDLVAGILSPLLEGLGFIVSLVMIPIMWVLSGITSVGKAIIEGLTPIINGISDVLGGVINAATTVIDGAIGALETALGAAIGAVETAVGGVTTALGALAEGVWNQLMTLASSIADLVEDILVLVIPLLTDILNQYFTWVLGFYEDILNNLLFTIFDEIIAALGLTDLVTLMLTFFTDVLVVLGSIIILITVVMGFFFESAVFWFEPSRFMAAMSALFIIVCAWLFYPLFVVFAALADGEISVDLLTETFEVMFVKFEKIFSFAWGFISYVFEFMLSLLTTIGGFIPLT